MAVKPEDEKRGEKAAIASTLATLGAIIGGPVGLVAGGLLGYAFASKWLK